MRQHNLNERKMAISTQDDVLMIAGNNIQNSEDLVVAGYYQAKFEEIPVRVQNC